RSRLARSPTRRSSDLTSCLDQRSFGQYLYQMASVLSRSSHIRSCSHMLSGVCGKGLCLFFLFSRLFLQKVLQNLVFVFYKNSLKIGRAHVCTPVTFRS